MAVEDFAEPEVALAIAITAAVASPRARRIMRRSAVLGMAGALRAGDALGSFARGAGRGVQQGFAAATETENEGSETGERPRNGAPPRKVARPQKPQTAPADGERR